MRKESFRPVSMGPEALSSDGQGVNQDVIEDSSGMTRSTVNFSEDRGKDDRVSIGSRPDSGAISANESHPMEPFQNISESVPNTLQLEPDVLQSLQEKAPVLSVLHVTELNLVIIRFS